jgi:hypothetical protein
MERVNYLKNVIRRVQIFRVSLYKNYCKMNLISAGNKSFNCPALWVGIIMDICLENSGAEEKYKEIM